jgi:hypothetical protein
MVIQHTGLSTMNDCADEGWQQFTQLTNLLDLIILIIFGKQ